MSFIEQSEKNTKTYNSSFKEKKKSVPLLKEVPTEIDIVDENNSLEMSISFIEESKQNTKKYNSSFKKRKKSVPLLKEVSGGSVAGFTGRPGRDIDAVFAGGFHPDSGHGSKNLELLKKQIEDRIQKLKDTDSFEANPVGGWYDIDTETNRLAFEELITIADMVKLYNDENKPPQDTEWKSTGWEYNFDDIYIHIDNEEDFINQSEINMEKVGVDIKYDDIIPTYDKEDFINKSTTNWKLVGRK